MSDIAWPTGVLPISTGFESVPNAWVFENGESRTETTYEMPGHLWRQQVTLPDLGGDERIEMQMFLIALRGPVNSVLLPDFAHRRRGAGGGTPRVNGAGQLGRSLTIDGAPVSTSAWLRKGDYFSLPNYELFRLMADVDTDGSGAAVLTFEPAIHVAPLDNALIEIDTPMARCRLNTRSASWTNIAQPIDGFDVRSGFSLDFIQRRFA